MIILPALPAIVAALTPVAKAALISAGIGAAVGGATCAVGGIVSSYHDHGEMNREVAANTIRGAAQCAGEGALVGGAFGGAGVMFAPAIAPAVQVIDDVARPIVQVADDAARPVIQVVDDAAQSTKSAAKAAFKSNAFPWNNALNSFRASIYKRLPTANARADDGYVYVMKDVVSGNSKIGRTVNPAQRLKGVQSKVGHKEVSFTCIIHSHEFKELEKHMHLEFASQRLPDTGAGTEWFDLSSDLVAKACSY